MKFKEKMVSVLMVTYNHERYIAQAIEGALMQKTNFDYEIVIGEDCSTDKTREIVLKYKETYPDKIKLVLQERNVGANQNFLDTLNACTGEYIAICEGDDYWIDPYKLQKQVDFLEVNPDYSAIGHQAEKISKDKKKEYYSVLKEKGRISKKQIINSIIFHTNSILFRKNALMKYDLKKIPILVEHAIYILLAYSGKFYYLPETMSVYRRHNEGKSAKGISSISYYEEIAWIKGVKNALGWKFFWGYHYLSSYIHLYFAIYYPDIRKKNSIIKYYCFKYLLISLLLYPRNIRYVIRLLKDLFFSKK